MSKRILLVGHCGIDGPRMKEEMAKGLPSVTVDRINSDADLRQACKEGAELLLVNREPVGFEGEGLEIIQSVKTDYPDCKVMLVSDKKDAQSEAVTIGALKGFGKSELGTSSYIEHVKQALG